MGHRGPTVPEEHGARLAPEQKGAQGIRSPLGQQTSSAQEGTRSLRWFRSPNKIPSSILIGWGLPNIT